MVKAVVPEDWPADEAASAGLSVHLANIRREGSEEEWRIRLIVSRQTREMVASPSFKKPPRSDGRRSSGGGLIPQYRQHFLAPQVTVDQLPAPQIVYPSRP